jgi:hypothetical protein
MVRVERRGRAKERGEDERGETKQGREEREERKERKKRERGRDTETNKKPGARAKTRPITWHSIFVALFPSSDHPSSFVWYSLSPVGHHTIILLPDQDDNFHGLWLKKYDDMSQCLHTAPHSCAACTGNSNTTSFPVNRRYTDENESSLYSNDVESLASKNLEIVPIIK